LNDGSPRRRWIVDGTVDLVAAEVSWRAGDARGTQSELRVHEHELGIQLAAGALARRLGTRVTSGDFTTPICSTCGRQHGKPVVRQLIDADFSISHSDGLVLVAICDRPVGVDVERNLPRDPNTLLQYLHPQEQAQVRQLEEGERAAAVLRCWVRKEACLKSVGLGLTEDLRRWKVLLRGPVLVAAPGGQRLQVRDLVRPDGVRACAAAVAIVVRER